MTVYEPCELHEITNCSVCTGLDKKLADEEQESLVPIGPFTPALFAGKCPKCGGERSDRLPYRVELDLLPMTTVQVIETPALRVDEMMWTGERTVLLGIRPLNTFERAGYDVFQSVIVNHGLKDVVRWLGEKPLPVAPQSPIWDLLRKGYEVEVPGFFG